MLAHLRAYLRGFASDRRGISAVEYGILGAVVVVALVAAGPSLGTAVTAAFTRLTTALNGAGG